MFSTATKFMSTIQRVLKAILLEHNKPLKHNNNLKLAQTPTLVCTNPDPDTLTIFIT